MATTSFVALREMEKGFKGRGIVAGVLVGWVRVWICSVLSQEAEMSVAGASMLACLVI